MATDNYRFTISVDEELFNEIEDFRFENRYQTRSEACMDILKLGLKAVMENQSDKKEKK